MIIIVIILIIIIIIIFYVQFYKPVQFYQSVQNPVQNIVQTHPKILIISCYGYGNMGDNMYAEVFTKFLPDCEIVKLSDSTPFVNSEKQIVWNPPKNNYNFDYLIIGGGGLITANKIKKSKNLPYYVNYAMKNNKKLFIVSCGVQGSVDNFKNDFKDWIDIFNYATFITVRSKKDKELLELYNLKNVFYFRDLGYIYPHLINKKRYPNKLITLIVAGPVHSENPIIKNNISENDTVVIMNMGSLLDDNNNNRIRKMNFPNVYKFYGSGRAPEFSKTKSIFVNQQQMEHILRIDPNLVSINPSDITLEEVVNIIYNSKMVYTGRFHGKVFASSLGIPYDTLGMNTNKMLWEEPFETYEIKKIIQNSFNSIKMLRKNMDLPEINLESYINE